MVGFQDIRFRSEVEDVVLGLDQAIPCGLMINELTSDSLKYVYPSGRKGEIRVGLTKTDASYTLVVSDEGIGFSPEVDCPLDRFSRSAADQHTHQPAARQHRHEEPSGHAVHDRVSG